MSDLPPEIQRLSTAEKQALVYAIWEAIEEEEAGAELSQSQKDMLDERKRRRESGESKCLPFEQAKSELRALIDAH